MIKISYNCSCPVSKIEKIVQKDSQWILIFKILIIKMNMILGQIKINCYMDNNQAIKKIKVIERMRITRMKIEIKNY